MKIRLKTPDCKLRENLLNFTFKTAARKLYEPNCGGVDIAQAKQPGQIVMSLHHISDRVALLKRVRTGSQNIKMKRFVNQCTNYLPDTGDGLSRLSGDIVDEPRREAVK